MLNPILIFDADGVVINGKKFSQHLADDYGLTSAQTSEFFTGPFNACLEGKADLVEVIQPYLVQWGWQGTVVDFIKYWFTAEHSVDMELIDVIQQLRADGIRAYVATNQEKYRTEYMKVEMQFQKWFDGIFSSAQLGCKKPAAEFYVQMLTKLEADPQHVWFFDDTQANVDAAVEQGMQAIHYSSIKDFLKTAYQELWLEKKSYSSITDKIFPAGSLNQAMAGPSPREIPFSSCLKPS